MPDDQSEGPLTTDNVIEILNELAIYIGKKEFKMNFCEQESFHKRMLLKWKEWQKV
jgi:hypothetical protein